MTVAHILGFPRIGAKRELKLALEAYWRGEISEPELSNVGRELRKRHWQRQRDAGLDFVTVGDFAWYDSVLQTLAHLGCVPGRFGFDPRALTLPQYFTLARGDADHPAMEMTKWFDTNYHYLVPEWNADTRFEGGVDWLFREVKEARNQGHAVKVALPGPLTLLHIGKIKAGPSHKLDLLPRAVLAYQRLLASIKALGIPWVQIDEPILGLDLEERWLAAFRPTYEALAPSSPKILLATYFESVAEHAAMLKSLPVAGIHLDLVRGPQQLAAFLSGYPESKVLAFAVQKLDEIAALKQGVEGDPKAIMPALMASREAAASRRRSERVLSDAVRRRLDALSERDMRRPSPFAARIRKQRARLKLPLLPTTTIGSFPQTPEIRKARAAFKKGALGREAYVEAMRAEIRQTGARQEALELDVLVHGEAERNDMVEYYGEQLRGFAFTESGWVQSYGSRCVKPPVIYGDVSRPGPMTVEWTRYAQSLTEKPMKGMLTGPITMLQWSFVRDDQPRSKTAFQIALALREEVLDIERAGIAIIQIDEPALREGLPLKKRDWARYLEWAVRAFKLVSSGVADGTQIHTHMCYAEFNDILPSIAALDADVITIETSRSDMELLEGFGEFRYPNEIGPGVYDIHSPRVPDAGEMLKLLEKAECVIPLERLWVNPDCGLKTRGWPETEAALARMVEAARRMRARVQNPRSARASA